MDSYSPIPCPSTFALGRHNSACPGRSRGRLLHRYGLRARPDQATKSYSWTTQRDAGQPAAPQTSATSASITYKTASHNPSTAALDNYSPIPCPSPSFCSPQFRWPGPRISRLIHRYGLRIDPPNISLNNTRRRSSPLSSTVLYSSFSIPEPVSMVVSTECAPRAQRN